ncbi:MAG: hypothetical protein JNJ54_24755 [Myxococcaceae bacterium]|nr:hypothetical protein [Myxococcaceae bacterium]
MTAFALTLAAATSLAAPRLVVQPVTASAPLPGAANAAWLTAVASLAVELPSTFEVDDALATLPSRSCGLEARCLARLAVATRCPFALAVAVQPSGAGSKLIARVANAEGAIVREGERDEPVTPTREADWLRAFRALTSALSLETLDEAAAVTLPPAPLPASPSPPLVPARVAPAPDVGVAAALVEPARPTWRTTVAVTAGAVAVAAGAAATTLAVMNLGEARALAAASQGALLPAWAVERAVALDERTTLAAGLGAGAAVAAAVAIITLALPGERPVTVSLSPRADGAGVSLGGRLP